MTKSKNVHVVPHDNGWATKTENSSRASKVYETKVEAITGGRTQAQNNQSELVIHNKNGRISDKDSYGKDPNPPKDRVH